MFTGIIEDIGTVKSVEKEGSSGRITVETNLDLRDFSIGESINVDGACLTVVDISGSSFEADLSEETLKLTTLGELKRGSRVNLERPLTPAKPMGGHIVTGHVDAAGTIKRIVPKGDNLDIEVEVPELLRAHLVRKGSVALDGISLTIAEVLDAGFRAAIIPHTIARTTLSIKKTGAKVNIETDIIGKYVERFLKGHRKSTSLTEDFLSEHGFLEGKKEGF